MDAPRAAGEPPRRRDSAQRARLARLRAEEKRKQAESARASARILLDSADRQRREVRALWESFRDRQARDGIDPPHP